MRRAPLASSSGIALALIALAGCGDRLPPLPSITGVAPDNGQVDQSIPVQVLGTGFAVRVFTDFDDPDQTHTDDTYRLSIGGVELTGVQHVSTTLLTGTLPPGVQEGLNDLWVTDPWNRVTALPGAFFGAPVGGPPTLLSLTSAAIIVPIGTCQAVTVEQHNASDVPTVSRAALAVTLDASPAGAFLIYSDSSCSTAITSVTIPSGQTAATVYVQATARGIPDLLASAASLTPDNFTFVFGPTGLALPPGTLSLSGTACSMTAIALETQDPAGLASAVDVPTTIDLSVSPTTGLAVYDTANCMGSPVSQVTIPAGGSSVGFYVKGTVQGGYTVSASASTYGGDSMSVSLTIVTNNIFVFAPIAPQEQLRPFLVTIEAQDGLGNLVPGFVGTATLAGLGGSNISCVSNCNTTSTTTGFLQGKWSGWVLATPAASGASIHASSGTIAGDSGLFDVMTPAVAFPMPTARLGVAPGAVNNAGTTVTLDARLSSDPTGASLEYSFDMLGTTTNAPGTSPWTAWSGTTTYSAAGGYSTAGVYRPRVAVRETANPAIVAYASATVVFPSSTLCVVNTASLRDDNATNCTMSNKWGGDNVLSLTEAVRLANAGAGRAVTANQVYRFNFTATDSIDSIIRSTSLSFPTGTQLINAPIDADAFGVLVANVEISGTQPWTVSSGDLQVNDSVVHDFAGFEADAPLTLRRVLMFNCSPAGRCADISGPSGSLQMIQSEIRDAPGGGVRLQTGGTCPATALDVTTSTFLRAGLAIRNDCPTGSRIAHTTFHGNVTGITYVGTGNHSLQNNIFTANGTAASCGSANFGGNKDYNLLFGNGADGCVFGDANTITADPLYFIPEADLRLRSGSPARDSMLDLGLDVNDSGLFNYFGAGPDRGGRETP